VPRRAGLGGDAMMTCKDVSRLVLADRVSEAPLRVWLHLAMCRHCRAFRLQIVAITRWARGVALSTEREPDVHFESRLADALTRQRPPNPEPGASGA
jgi:predicted anti-sigma-YlaC factor YlaD